MIENGDDDARVGDHRQPAQRYAAARAVTDIEIEHAAQALQSGHRCPASHRLGLLFPTLGRGRCRRHDEAAVAGVGCQGPVITGMSVLRANNAERCFCQGSVEPITSGPGAAMKR